MKNEMELIFDAISDNEGFARVAVAAFVTGRNPTVEEIADIKTAVSEAVTNAIIHGYGNPDRESVRGQECRLKTKQEKVRLHCILDGDDLHIEISDRGRGIEDVEKAMEPLFTTRPELERSGMGFAFMEAFMDELEVESAPGVGTVVRMRKCLGASDWPEQEE